MTDLDPYTPTRWLNYAGDVRGHVPAAMGPNSLGEVLYPVEVSYDSETDRSRVGLSKIAPGDLS